jgi:hypothetical protein
MLPMVTEPSNYQRAAQAVIEALDLSYKDGISVKSPSSPFVAPLVAFYATRTLRYYEAILMLAQGGFAVEAQPLVRVLLEDLINLRYIATGPDRLADEWAQHEARVRHRLHRQWAAANSGIEPPTDIEELERQYKRDVEKIRSRRNGRRLSQRKVVDEIDRMSWAGNLGLAARAKAADASGKYANTEHGHRQFYWYLCDSTHGNASGLYDYFADVSGDLHVLGHQGAYKRDTVVFLATRYLHFIQGALRDLGLVSDVDVFGVATDYVDVDSGPDDFDRKFDAGDGA